VEVIAAGDLEKPPATRRVIGLEPGQPVYRLLVVDDQEVNRRLLLKLFRPLGFDVREAANGQEALAVWEAWQPHLIWMDMRMPVMDGYEATRRIKATTRGMATIIIALTASALEEDRAVILSEGCDDYIRKPFREDELFTAVARYLGARYVYEEIAPAATSTAGSGMPQVPADDLSELAAQMQSTSPQWRAQLEHATVLGDQDSIQQLADQVAAQNPRLAKTLQHLASQYDHDRILTAIHDAQGLTNDDGH
jgi:CheY-like chemotaxis protein